MAPYYPTAYDTSTVGWFANEPLGWQSTSTMPNGNAHWFNAPSSIAPALAQEFLDFAHLRSRNIGMTVKSLCLRRKAAALAARAHALAVRLTSWWDRTREDEVGDVLHQPVAQTAIPPRTARPLRGAPDARVSLRPVGLAARLGGDR